MFLKQIKDLMKTKDVTSTEQHQSTMTIFDNRNESISYDINDNFDNASAVEFDVGLPSSKDNEIQLFDTGEQVNATEGMNLQFPVSANDPEFDNNITQEFKSVMKEKARKMISDKNGLKKFNQIVQKAARYLTSISKEKLKLNVTFDSISGMPDATVTCLDCSMTFKPSHAADRYFYFNDLINQTHSHFKHHSSGNTSEKQSVVDTFFKKSENYKSQKQKSPKLYSSVKEQFKCEGLGKMIGLNCFNSNKKFPCICK